MAIHNIQEEMAKLFEDEIKALAKAQLARQGIEVLIFTEDLVMDYMKWAESIALAGKATSGDDPFSSAKGGKGARTKSQLGSKTAAKDRFFSSLKANIKVEGATGAYVVDTADGIKIFNVVTDKAGGVPFTLGGKEVMPSTSYFQAGRGGTSPIRRAVTRAKRAAMHVLVPSHTVEEGTYLISQMHGHHGGIRGDANKSTRLQTAEYLGGKYGGEVGQNIKELYDGNITGEGMADSYLQGFEQGAPDIEGAFPTTGGMLEGMKKMNEKYGGDDESIHNLMTGSDEITQDMLARVVYTDLRRFFIVKMGWDQDPFQQLTGNDSKPTIEVYNQIFVTFARGGGQAGQDFTEAMKAYDAGQNNSLTNTLNRVLQNIEIDIVKRVVHYYGQANVDKLLHLRGSPSVVEHTIQGTTKNLVQALFNHKSTPDMRFKVNKALLAQQVQKLSGKKVKPKKTGNVGKAKTKRSRKQKLPAAAAAVAVKDSQRKRGIDKLNVKAGSNIQLRNLLNQIVPTQVARNMTAPRLRYRTGRLANSVRVSEITTGPRGGNMQIVTDYATDPYGVYAPGGKRYTPQRDPERLIKKSVRQVAQAMLGTRFGIRVNR